MKFCPECGTKLILEKFCHECGADIGKYLNNARKNTKESISTFDFSALEKEAQNQLSRQNRLERIRADFEMDGDVLVKYKGAGGAVCIPKEARIVGEKAFENNPSITEITFEEGVEEIRGCAFWCAKNLKKVTFPKSLKKLGGCLFQGTAIEEMTIPEGFTELPMKTFYGCKKLKKVTLPDSLTVIHELAFAETSKLLTLFIPKSVHTIESVAFLNSGLVNLYFESSTLPKNLAKESDRYFYRGWFEGCDAAKHFGYSRHNIHYIDFDEEARIYGSSIDTFNENDFYKEWNEVCCKRPMTSVKFPYGMKTLRKSNLEKSPDVVNLTLPETVTQIDFSFYCLNYAPNATLRTVHAEGVSTISDQAFRRCEQLNSFYGNSSMKSIGAFAFAECIHLTNFQFPTNLEKLGSYAFYQVPALKTLTLPSSLRVIEQSTFCECPNLEHVEICDGVEEVGSSAFRDCKRLKTVTIPGTVQKIGEMAFADCEQLESVVLSEGIKSIGGAAFKNCTSLRSIKIPYSVTSLDTSWATFEGCASLQFIYIPRGRVDAFRNAFPWHMTFIEY
ncbi:MAG: leucine-rich repeat domain-containing protein [Clostridia bacterium]|nr:leucine-rich repeat domain-containing protein [Clostridia bacterium]